MQNEPGEDFLCCFSNFQATSMHFPDLKLHGHFSPGFQPVGNSLYNHVEISEAISVSDLI